MIACMAARAVTSTAMAVERSFVFADLAGFTAAVDVHGDDAAVELAEALEGAASRALGPGDELVKSMGDAVLVAHRSDGGSHVPAHAVRSLRDQRRRPPPPPTSRRASRQRCSSGR